MSSLVNTTDLQTTHRVYPYSAKTLAPTPDGSVHLVVTSPPYPMIGMWDESFAAQNPATGVLLHEEQATEAFESMHTLLDSIWEESFRILAPGGILCVNVGDAVRKLGGHFRLFTNHSRIISSAQRAGFSSLPGILWRKPTNAPNKFMGSGMLPGGAYVTLEHEHILVFRKEGNRNFETPELKALRRKSAFFWEERNLWFSDLWDIGGARQSWGSDAGGAEIRSRSGAFPFEIPFRLISMFTIYGDTVADPFWGSGTTSLAATALGRNSLGWEIDSEVARVGFERMIHSFDQLQGLSKRRIDTHRQFIAQRLGGGKVFKHINRWTGLPVITGQETDLEFFDPIEMTDTDSWEVQVTHRVNRYEFSKSLGTKLASPGVNLHT